MGRLNEALNDANRAVRLAPTYPFVYGGRGTVFADMGRYGLALDDYTKAILLDSKDGGLFVGRGKIFVRSGQLNEAVADFTHALESVRKVNQLRQSFLSMRRIEARRRKASALRVRFSKSLAKRRQRLSHAKVRSTTQRRGRSSNPLA